jgi:hypothetical protein
LIDFINQNRRKSFNIPMLRIEKKFRLLPSRVSDTNDQPRSAVPINLTPRARDVVDNLKSRTKLPKQEAVRVILEWFASQPEVIQDAIFDPRRDVATELARLKLAEMAAAGTGDVSGMSIGDAIRATKVLLDRIETVSTVQEEMFGMKGTGKKKG